MLKVKYEILVLQICLPSSVIEKSQGWNSMLNFKELCYLHDNQYLANSDVNINEFLSELTLSVNLEGVCLKIMSAQ